jgi:hypothetical protein
MRSALLAAPIIFQTQAFQQESKLDYLKTELDSSRNSAFEKTNECKYRWPSGLEGINNYLARIGLKALIYS